MVFWGNLDLGNTLSDFKSLYCHLWAVSGFLTHIQEGLLNVDFLNFNKFEMLKMILMILSKVMLNIELIIFQFFMLFSLYLLVSIGIHILKLFLSFINCFISEIENFISHWRQATLAYKIFGHDLRICVLLGTFFHMPTRHHSQLNTMFNSKKLGTEMKRAHFYVS